MMQTTLVPYEKRTNHFRVLRRGVQVARAVKQPSGLYELHPDAKHFKSTDRTRRILDADAIEQFCTMYIKTKQE